MDFPRLLFILAIGVSGVAIFSFTLLIRNTNLPRMEISETPDRYGIIYSEVQFKSCDGLILKGWSAVQDDSVPTIILCHGLGTNRSDMLIFASFLHKAGWNLFLFDFRGHGESQGKVTSFGYLEQRDLAGAIQYLDSRSDLVDHRYGVFGISMGAAVAVLEAAQNPKIQAVAADSCFASLSASIKRYVTLLYHLPSFLFGDLACLAWEVRFRTSIRAVSPQDRIGEIAPRAILILQGEKDDRILASEAAQLFERANNPKELWIIPGAGHLESFHLDPQGYRDRVTQFFKKNLPLNAKRTLS